jgi:FMN phosphatase YigB (HAD superfamily)
VRGSDAIEFDAVLFDVGGVLVVPDPTVLVPLLAPFGASTDHQTHVRAHYAGMAAKSAAGSGERDWAVYDRAYVHAVGADESAAELAAVVLGATRNAHVWRYPLADSVSTIRRLSAAGVPMGVVSNASGQIEQMLRYTSICQVGSGNGVAMRVIVDSHVVGVAKPDPAIFDHALPAFTEFERSRIAYVGDSVTMDIGAATAAGLLPILLDPYDDHAGAAFRRIALLSELLVGMGSTEPR